MRRLFALAFGLVALHTVEIRAAGDDPKGIDFFEKNIRPVLVANCYQCHSASREGAEGRTAAGYEGRASQGRRERAGHRSGQARRKPADQGPAARRRPGDAAEGQAARQRRSPISVKWIEMGAPDPRKPNVTTVGGKINLAKPSKFWSFQPPKIVSAAGCEEHRLAQERYRPLSAGGTGSEESRAGRRRRPRHAHSPRLFRSDRPAADSRRNRKHSSATTIRKAFEKVVDRLLAMPQFGERWGRHWLDVARYGESIEQGAEHSLSVWPGSIATTSMTRSRPTSRTTNSSASKSPATCCRPRTTPSENEMLTATGFLALGPKSLNTRNQEQFRMDVADEQIDVATRGVMGLSVACARCHDHKFDPIPTADYYAMAGIFRSTEVLGGVKPRQQQDGLLRRVRLSGQRRASEATPVADDRKRVGRAEQRSWKRPRTKMQQVRASRRKKSSPA